MGLDTTHDAWHGAYSAFTRWRNGVAKAAGYQIVEVVASYGMTYPQPAIDWDSIRPENYEGAWAATPEDPLVVLIAHSDCDGVIHPEQAGPLADRLEGLLPALDAQGEGGGHISRDGGYRTVTERFIAGLRAAVEAGEDVEFH